MIRNEPFSEYLSRPQLSGSQLVHILDSPRQLKWVLDHGYQPKTDTRVGTALHSLVEYLPIDKFFGSYCVEPNFAIHQDNVDAKGNPSSHPGTKWVREQKQAFAALETREVLTWKQYSRVARMLESMQDNRESLDLIMHSIREPVLVEELWGVEMCGRPDGINGAALWNLKTSRSNQAHKFGRVCDNLHYLMKDAIYVLLLRKLGVEIKSMYYIVVKDAVPREDGSYNECPDCSVVEVPMVALENQFPRIREALELYKNCLANDSWPGVGNYDLPIFDMPEVTLVD